MRGAHRLVLAPQAPPRRPRRLVLLPALALAAIAVTGLVGAPETPSASAQTAPAQPTTATAQHRDCETVDLLLLMDQSGSLNEADPGGAQRRAALHSIRSDLSDQPRIRVALIGFDSDLNPHAEQFEPAAEDGSAHPSEDELEASLVGGGFTDYGVALRGALEAFRDASEGSCRELVWFTDGIHDTAVPSTEEEVAQAEALRDDVCGVMAQDFADGAVRTQVVLLGGSFARSAQSQNSLDRRLAELSAQIMSAVTGDKTIAGIPVGTSCDIGNLAPGDVLEGEPIDLPNRFIESVVVIRDLRRWSDCVTASGGIRTSDRLPAGTYIDALEIFSYGGTIERYRLGELGWDATSPGSRRVALKHAALRGLPSGWVLELEVASDAGTDIADVKLSCYSKPVSEPLRMEGRAIDPEAGDTASLLEAGRRYELDVDMVGYDCATGDFELRIEALADPRRGSARCVDGDARFSFEAVPSDKDYRRVTEATGQLVPEHADLLWPADPMFAVDIEVRPPATILSDVPLECWQDTDVPRVEIDSGTEVQAPRARIVAGMCRLTPQPDGETSADIETSPGQPPYHFETPDGEPVEQPFVPGDGHQQFVVISDEMAPDELPGTPGTVTVLAEFRPSDGRPPTELRSEELPIGQAAPALVCEGSRVLGDAVDSSGMVLPRVETQDGDAGSRLVLDECHQAPGGGPARLETQGGQWIFADPDGRPIPQPMPVGGDEAEPFVIVLEDWTGDASPAVIVQRTPGDGSQSLPVWTEIRVPKTPVWSGLNCGLDDSLPMIMPGLPLRVVADACRVDPPASGSFTVAPQLAVESNLRYFVEAPERVGEAPWSLDGDAAPLALRVVSDELGRNGWDYEGSITLTVTAIPTSGVAQVHRRTISLPPDLLGNKLSCDESIDITNADDDEVPTEPLRATLNCEFALRGPHGDLLLAVDGSFSGTGGSAPLRDWRFLPASDLLEDGRGLRFNDGEELFALGLVTADSLPNDRIQGDGTVEVSAKWTAPGWQEPLTAVATAEYRVDLWPRSVLWLALLITAAAALVTWFLLYGVVATANRLPRSSNFFARRLEFSAHRDARGKLRSKEIEGFNPDDHPSVRVDGDSSQKWLQAEELRIEAKHPKWWQVASLLRGGWGEATVRGLGGPIGARPAGPRARAATTREQFSELAVVALESSSGAAETHGVAYVLEPQRPSERSDTRRLLTDVLADMTPRRTTAASRPMSQDDTNPPPRDASRPPPREASKPPSRQVSKLPPNERPE